MNQTIIQQFLAHAEKHPEKVSVTDIQGAYTYGQLNRRSAYLAEQVLARLAEQGMEKGRIAVLLPRTKDYLTALLAVFRAGCTAVPMDGEYPAERVRVMLEDAGCSLCVTTGARAGEITGTACLCLEDVLPEGEDHFDADTALDRTSLEAEGLILYTSGSTGKPKGVVHRLRVLNSYADTLTGYIPLSAETRTLCIAGFSFIASQIDLILPLYFGGSVYIANEKERKDVENIWELFGKRWITGMFLPPQMYGVMRKLHGPLPLEYVILAGEKAQAERTPEDPTIYEFYGASEMPCMVLHPLGDGDARSLGKPCRGFSAYLMDEEGRLITEPGVIGELCMASPYMAIGYLNRPEETAAKFVTAPDVPGGRLFHTGDQMAWDEDGSLLFHGRKDHMVKIRGYRVELDEVRQAAARFPGIEEAACFAVKVNGGDHLCCYYTGEEVAKEALKDFIGESLPDYMVPEYCIHLEALPRNERNKVDFQKLKSLEIRAEDAEYDPPATEKETQVCRAFGEALGMEKVSATADFFDCGGTSLSAAVLISALDEDTPVSFQDVSTHPTPRELAAFLESRAARPMEKLEMNQADYPLTKTQMGIYLEGLTGGSKETYTTAYLARARENVTPAELIHAAQRVMDAHPGMKYMIHAGADGMPRMVPQPDAILEIPIVDGTEDDRLDFMKEFYPVVPMLDQPLLRLAVYRTPERCYLAMKSHLIYFDGTSISLFISEMNRAMGDMNLLGEDYTIQQCALVEERQMVDGSHDRAKEYYLNLFKDVEDMPALSGDLNGPLTPGVSENLRYEPGTLDVARVKAFCEKEHISESSFFQGAMGLMLGKYLNSKHVSFSTVYNGRPLAEMNHTIGTLIKRIPVYANLSKNTPVGDYLRGISKQIFSTMANDIYSFDEVLKTCPVNEDVEFIYQGDLFTDNMGREGSGAPVGRSPKAKATRTSQPKQAAAPLQGSERLENCPVDSSQWRTGGSPGGDAAPIEVADREGSGAPDLLQGDKWFMEHYHTGMVTGCMSIQFFATDGLYNMTIEYRNEKFTEGWVRRFAQDLFTTAEQLMTAESIDQVSLLTAEDKARLARFNDTRVPMEFIPVQEQIHRHAVVNPDKTAVIAAGRKLTFRQLDDLSSFLAARLIEKGMGPNQMAGVLFDREIWAYVAEIAVLKAGGAFLPFIPEYPDDRIDFCLADGACPLLLTTRKQLEGRKLSPADTRVWTLEEAFGVETLDEVQPERYTEAMPDPAITPNDLAYCIYTSGSTGRPKGVMIEHRNIMNYVHRNEKSLEIMHYAAPGRVNLALASFSFDVSVVEEFVPLCNGNTVVIATEEEIHDPALFAKLVRETGADGITCTPTYLLSLLEIPESREAIRQFTFFDIGAEAFPRQLYDRLRELRQDSVILNVYGPTECTMGCAAALMTGEPQVTVGPPIANTEFYVADTFGNELPVGLKGELIICGDQVGRGYVNLQEKSAAAFFEHDGLQAYHSGDLAAWTEKGEVRIFGRIDNQIKLRGFRIELDEIEKVITEYPGISSSAASVRKTGGTEYLAGYYTANTPVDEEKLKAFLQEKLPEYMVPSVMTRLDEMPMTQNGKVNRKALPEPNLQSLMAEYVAPETETEKKICAAFARVLKLEEGRVGLMDDFFLLGGDSLSAMIVMAEAEIEELTAVDIFQHRTPGRIAEALRERENGETMDLNKMEQEAREATHALTPVQYEMLDNQLFRPDNTTLSLYRFLLRFGEETDADRLCDAVNRMLRNHPALHMKFFFDENFELRQQYDPDLIQTVTIRDIRPETEDALGDILVRPFDKLLNSSLCRAQLFRGRRGTYLYMDIHHLLIDASSLDSLFGDLIDAYHGRDLPKDYYLAFLAMEEGNLSRQQEADRKYHLERYGNGSDWCGTIFPDDPTLAYREETLIRRLPVTEDQIAAAEKRLGVTLSVMQIAAALRALASITGEQRVMMHWNFCNRIEPETKRSVGSYLKYLTVACDMEEIHSTQELLSAVREQVLSGIAHSTYNYLISDVYSRGLPWIETNLEIDMGGTVIEEMHPEILDLEDPYAQTVGNYMQVILQQNEHGDGATDSLLIYRGTGCTREQLEQYFQEINRYLEKLILDE